MLNLNSQLKVLSRSGNKILLAADINNGIKMLEVKKILAMLNLPIVKYTISTIQGLGASFILISLIVEGYTMYINKADKMDVIHLVVEKIFYLFMVYTGPAIIIAVLRGTLFRG